MRTDYVYLKVIFDCGTDTERTVKFDKDEVVNGEVYNLLPSSVSPTSELIKSADRSLDGTMNVDITGVKISLAVSFDYLEDKDFQFISDIFDLQKQAAKYPDGITVEYFDIKDSGAKKRITCFIDSVDYMPFIMEDTIAWRDVKINLVEI